MTPSITACPPTRMSSLDEVSAQEVAVKGRCFRYLISFETLWFKLESLCLLPVFPLKSFNAAGSIDQFLLSCKKGMAFGADFQVDLRFRRACLEGFPAGALHDRVDVVRMYACFH